MAAAINLLSQIKTNPASSAGRWRINSNPEIQCFRSKIQRSDPVDRNKLTLFLDQTGRFSGQRRRFYETTQVNQRTAEYRISKGGFATLRNFYNIGRIQYSMFDIGRSMFDVHKFLIRFDWTLAASGGADT